MKLFLSVSLLFLSFSTYCQSSKSGTPVKLVGTERVSAIDRTLSNDTNRYNLDMFSTEELHAIKSSKITIGNEPIGDFHYGEKFELNEEQQKQFDKMVAEGFFENIETTTIKSGIPIISLDDYGYNLAEGAISGPLLKKSSPKYSRARIFYNQRKDLFLLAKNGVVVDHGNHKPGVYLESDYSENELNVARGLGLTVEILIEDVKKYYVDQNKPGFEDPLGKSNEAKNLNCSGSGGGSTDYTTPSNWSLGSMGGYFTYAELMAHLDNMAALYPNLITAKAPISTFTTEEGRPIYWLRISDNANTDEAEPEMLYSAIHHAREPASLSQLVFYMWYLLENYGTDPEVTAILDNTELYFVPLINPDGYVYNEVNSPSGGGMWRKNRRNNGGGDYGVDNNRNYSYQWGTTGISTDPGDDTYLGTAPFSEVENQAIKWLCEQREFVMALNSHTSGDMLLYPHGYDAVLTPDNATFEAISAMMVEQNGFNNMLSADLYPASGDSDDWMYTEVSTHDKIYAMTPEIGPSFWPASSQIENICKSTVYMNLTAAHLITNYATLNDLNPSIWNNLSGHVKYDIQRLGLQDPANFTVTFVGITNITFSSPTNTHNGMTLLQTDIDSVAYTLAGGIMDGATIKYAINVDNGTFITSDTIVKTYGNGTVVFADDASSMGNWTSADWAATSLEFYSPSSSITDSPGSSNNYSNNDVNTISLDQTIDLTNAISANLNFWAKWDIEAAYDYCQLQVSADGGSTWIPQCGKHTRAGSSNQDPGNPLWDGTQNSWVQEEIDLSDYLGQTIEFRFRLISDNWVTGDGFYFDDFEVTVVNGPAAIDHNENPFGLSQNMPNPTSGHTYINYDLPEGISKAELIITNNVGQLVDRHQLNLSARNIELDTRQLAHGAYFYFIQADGYRSASKRMVVAK